MSSHSYIPGVFKLFFPSTKMLGYFFVITFLICACSSAPADEIGDLKAQLQAMQDQINKQSQLLENQRRQIEELQTKISSLEAPKEAPKGAKKPEEKKENVLTASWKDGITFATDDKKFNLKVGGRLQADAAWFGQDSALTHVVGESRDRAEIRSFRLNAKGTIYEDFLYKLEGDFATGTMNLTDAYLGMKNIPYLGMVLVGHQFEPIGLEEMTSSSYLTFMEYSHLALVPMRNLGIEIYSNAFNERLTWQTGIFQDADNQGRSTSNKYNWTSRVTALPFYEKEKNALFHLGAAYSMRFPKDTLQYQARPDSHLAQYYADTGSFRADMVNLLGAEALFIYGPLSIQGEYVGSIVDRPDIAKDTYFQNAYIYGSYFLTGETRPYEKSQGVLGRVRPLKNLSFKDKTFGAWELAARYSYLDLTDGGINGRKLSDVTLGLNWYLNPNMKIMTNYIHSYVDDVGDADIVQTRFHVDF